MWPELELEDPQGVSSHPPCQYAKYPMRGSDIQILLMKHLMSLLVAPAGSFLPLCVSRTLINLNSSAQWEDCRRKMKASPAEVSFHCRTDVDCNGQPARSFLPLSHHHHSDDEDADPEAEDHHQASQGRRPLCSMDTRRWLGSASTWRVVIHRCCWVLRVASGGLLGVFAI